jgi:hypothetical protein
VLRKERNGWGGKETRGTKKRKSWGASRRWHWILPHMR